MSKIFVISGPSGVGKNSIANAVLKGHPNLAESISYTTRKPRDGEVDGEDYHFISEDRFNQLLDDGVFVEHAEVHGNMYGTSVYSIDILLNDLNKNVLIVLDVQGASIFKDSFPDAVLIFLVPPSLHDLKIRMLKRGVESEEELQTRLENAKEEMKKYVWYDWVVENDVLSEAIKDTEKIIHVESSLRPDGVTTIT
ncbi:MAG: guanylate kinase [Candidatus Peribacteraceae bacterium]|nr:guanylate kinase [Candidatus Peribacteraceae bacterium]